MGKHKSLVSLHRRAFIMMAENENATLQKQIEYLKNLINGANNESTYTSHRQQGMYNSGSAKPSSHWSSSNHKSKYAIFKARPEACTKYSLARVPSTSSRRSHHVTSTGTLHYGSPLVFRKNQPSHYTPIYTINQQGKSAGMQTNSNPKHEVTHSIGLPGKDNAIDRNIGTQGSSLSIQKYSSSSHLTKSLQESVSKDAELQSTSKHALSRRVVKLSGTAGVDSHASTSKLNPKVTRTVHLPTHTVKALPTQSQVTHKPKSAVGPLHQDSHTSASKPKPQVTRTVHLPSRTVSKAPPAQPQVIHKQKPFARSASDTCIQEKGRVVLTNKSQLKKSSTALDFAVCSKSDQMTVSGPCVAAVGTFSALRSGNKVSKLDTIGSPTVIKAGKKIIEEIERLNSAVAQLEQLTQKGLTQEKQKVVISKRGSATIVKPVRTILLPHSSSGTGSSNPNRSPSHQRATSLVKEEKYKFTKHPAIKEADVNDITSHSQIVATTSVPLKDTPRCNMDSISPNLSNMKCAVRKVQTFPCYETVSARGGSQIKHQPLVKRSPYKLVRSVTAVPQASRPQCSHSQVISSGRFKPSNHTSTSPRAPQSRPSRYKLTRRRSSSSSSSGKGTKHSLRAQIWSPRRRVYLSKRRLENGPIHIPTVPKVSVMDKQSLPSSSPPVVPATTKTALPAYAKANQSTDMRALLRDLSFIDTAFKTAKLQSSQKLLKRALVTKQKMMQRRSTEKRMTIPSMRVHRYSHTKCASPAARRPMLRSHSRSRSSIKGTQKSWNSRFSLKKSTSDADLTLNQLLGRSVDNMSSNKYKFINRFAPIQHSASKYPLRGPWYRAKDQVDKRSLRVDRRPKTLIHGRRRSSGSMVKARLLPGGRLVTIGGLVYATSSRKIARTSPRRSSYHQKVDTKTETKNVVIEGHQFKVTANTLLRVAQDKDGVKHVSLGGVKYIQTRPGRLVRAANTASRATASRFIYRSIATAAAAAARQQKVQKAKAYCIFFNRFGKCNRGDACPYLHDVEKVAVCTRFLRSTCKVTDCAFSHHVEPHKMPVCTHFLRGVCSRDACPYRHVKVSKDAALCSDFVNGYCPLADKCKKKHSRVCPDHDGLGHCPHGAVCKLFHPRRGEKRPAEVEMFPARRKPRAKKEDVYPDYWAGNLVRDHCYCRNDETNNWLDVRCGSTASVYIFHFHIIFLVTVTKRLRHIHQILLLTDQRVAAVPADQINCIPAPWNMQVEIKNGACGGTLKIIEYRLYMRTKITLEVQTPDFSMHVDDDQERNLPLAERHLPAFIPIFRTPTQHSPTLSPDVSASGEESLQIRPNLPFDAS